MEQRRYHRGFTAAFAPLYLCIGALLSLTRFAHASDSWWIVPIERALVSTMMLREESRPYSTPLRERDVSGAIAMSCEANEGRPCGDGIGVFGEADAAAGYGQRVSLSLRLRGGLGTGDHDEAVAIDGLLVDTRVGFLAVRAGRGVASFGPSARVQPGWGLHAAPLDHVRLFTPKPLDLGRDASLSASYVVGRLRAPQRYPNALVSVSRVEGGYSSFSLGLIQLLQLGGEGAPQLGLWDFIAEHVRRGDLTATESDTSNRRFGGDATLSVPALSDARLYYVLIFEDIRRRRWMDAVRYDADHLFGLELRSLGRDSRYGLTIEYLTTGVRSQEHFPRTTGFTNRGRVVGAPLGPDAESLYIAGRAAIHILTVIPSIELARMSSDRYMIVNDGPIDRVAIGEDEGRMRASLRVCAALERAITLDAEVLLERVNDFAFMPGVMRYHGGAIVSATWRPYSAERSTTLPPTPSSQCLFP